MKNGDRARSLLASQNDLVFGSDPLRTLRSPALIYRIHSTLTSVRVSCCCCEESLVQHGSEEPSE
jgi:hypothetical protein